MYFPPVKHRFHVCVPEPGVRPSHGCGRGRRGSGHRRQVRAGHHRPGQDRGRDQAQPGDLGNTWVLAILGQLSIVVIHFNINRKVAYTKYISFCVKQHYRLSESIDVKIEEHYYPGLLSNSDAIVSPVAGTGVHPSPLVQEIIGLAETSE